MLQDELLAGRPAHAYLLCCAEPARLKGAASQLAQALNCLRADPVGRPCGACSHCREIARGVFADFTMSAARKLAEVRAELARLAERPYVGRLKVLALAATSEMSREAHNALLKTLEEPPPTAVLILLVGSVDDVPATIVSRCRRIVLGATPWPLVAEKLVASGVESRKAAYAAACAGGDEELARTWAGRDDLEATRAAAVQFVAGALGPNPEPPLELVERHQERIGSGDNVSFWLAALDAALEAAIAARWAGQDSLRAAFSGAEWAGLGEVSPPAAAGLARRLHQAAAAIHYHAQVRLSLEAALLGFQGYGSRHRAFGPPQEGGT